MKDPNLVLYLNVMAMVIIIKSLDIPLSPIYVI